jgi:hypothetical protein
MAYRRIGSAVVNGFKPHNLTVEEAWALHHARYLASPDMWLPSGWRLSAGGIGILPVPMAHGTMWWEEIHAHRATQTRSNAPPVVGSAKQPRLGGLLPGAAGAGAGAAQQRCHRAAA